MHTHSADESIRGPDGETSRTVGLRRPALLAFGGAAFSLMAGAAVFRSRRPLRVAGVMMAGSGLAYLAQGWLLGAEGLSEANTAPTLGGYVLVFAWTIAPQVATRRGADRTRTRSSRVQPGKPAGLEGRTAI